MSSVLGKNGWWEEAEPSRENSRVLPGLNEGHVWLPLVWFGRFLFAMCLACVLSASPQTLISCMDPWPFSVAVGACHLIVTRTNTRRHRFLWYYWPVAWFQRENNHSVPALKTNPGPPTLLHQWQFLSFRFHFTVKRKEICKTTPLQGANSAVSPMCVLY